MVDVLSKILSTSLSGRQFSSRKIPAPTAPPISPLEGQVGTLPRVEEEAQPPIPPPPPFDILTGFPSPLPLERGRPPTIPLRKRGPNLFDVFFKTPERQAAGELLQRWLRELPLNRVLQKEIPIRGLIPGKETVTADEFLKHLAVVPLVGEIPGAAFKGILDFTPKMIASLLKRGGSGLLARAEDILGIPLRRGGLPKVIEPPSPTVVKVTNLIKEARPVRAEQKILRTEELGRRVSEAERLAEAVPALEKATVSTRALKGQLPTAEFAPVAEKVTKEEMDDLFNMIWKSDAQYFDKLNTDTALKKILIEGKIPTAGEDKLLSRFLGEDFVKALRSKRPLSKKVREAILDTLNIPRAVLASNDMSFPGRQGLLLLIGRPKRSLPAFKPMVKAHFSEKAALQIDEAIRLRPNFARAEAAGLFHAPIERGGGRLTGRQEEFMSKFAEFIPGVRMSERSFVTYGNKVRSDVFDDVLSKWNRNGARVTVALEKKLANYLNEATGRGSLGKRLDDLNDITSALFFSPRLQAARIKVGANLFKQPEIAREALRDISATVGTVMGLVSLAGLAGASIETDPRSSDFGKVRVGNTRLDFWGGFQQYARLMAMLISGQRKTTTTGEVIESNRLESLLRFVRTKLAPAAGLITDVLDQQTFIGEELFGDEAPSFANQAKDRLMSLFIQDMVDAIEEDGFPQGLIALPGFLGTGVVSFKTRKASQNRFEEAIKRGRKISKSQGGVAKGNQRFDEAIKRAKEQGF